MHGKIVGGLGKEKPFKPRLEVNVILEPAPKSDSTKGNVSFYFLSVWYGPVTSIKKDAPADTETETVLSLCHKKLCLTESVREKEEIYYKTRLRKYCEFQHQENLSSQPMKN